jgi:methionyl-tRNA formyltransferase
MKIIFAGTPEFARCALRALVDAGHELCAVLTQPDRPAGRKMQPQPSPVKTLALELGLPVLQPQTLKDPAAQQALRAMGADVMVVAAYGLILPQAVLDIPRLGAINIHASLLPRWRGAAPIQRALLAGDDETGVTIMRMEAGLDTGPMLLREALAIGPEDDTGTLHDRLADMGARMIVEVIQRLSTGPLEERPQPVEGVTYAHKIDKAESRIRWDRPAAELARAIRAYRPTPGVVARIRDAEIKLWRARVVPAGEWPSPAPQPGAVLSVSPEAVRVACGEGALDLLELQRPGGKRLLAAEFLRGFPLTAGDSFEH